MCPVANSGVVMLGISERDVNNCNAYARFLQAKCLVGDDPRHVLLSIYLSLSTDRSLNNPQEPKAFFVRKVAGYTKVGMEERNSLPLAPDY